MINPDGDIVLIDKPAGITSFGVVARLRRVLSKEAGKKVKVGHTGTLDPFASGLMILLTGKECRNAQQYSSLDKTYQTTIMLGQVSTTGDPEGQLSSISAEVPTRAQIEAALNKFRGKIEQRPPIYSAIKIDGQRAYKLARAGKDVEMPVRQVEIYGLTLDEYNYPELKLTAHVSSGTYIRTLAEDIGQSLGVGAYCRDLRRLTVGKWSVEDALSLTDLGVHD